MIFKQENKVGILEAPFEIKLGAEALMVYEYYNNHILDANCSLPYTFKNTILKLDELNHIKSNHSFYKVNQEYHANTFQKAVLVGFTGSLDSIFQALELQELGYCVSLFYLHYTTSLGQKRIKEVKNLAEKLKMHLTICEFKLKNDIYVENSFTNLLLYSLMLDCCQDRDIYCISSGDSLDFMRKTNNLSNLPEVTETFINELYLTTGFFDFIKAEKISKINKLKKLEEYNLSNKFNDCLNTDKFSKIRKNKIELQYNIKLPENNCGICRKCAFYNLLKYYYMNEYFPEEYIRICWKNIITDNNYIIFNESIPLAIRINNLSDC